MYRFKLKTFSVAQNVWEALQKSPSKKSLFWFHKCVFESDNTDKEAAVEYLFSSNFFLENNVKEQWLTKKTNKSNKIRQKKLKLPMWNEW